MSTIQNLKNFIRHGKQARDARSPQDQATTQVSNVHAQQQRFAGNPQQAGISEPNVYDHKPLQGHAVHQDYSAAAVDNRNVAAQAGHAAAGAIDQKQKQKDYDPSVLERIVAEERESKGKLPRYPGLERWTLIEKMGDGAFSNVYRAKDNNGVYDQVAIKVVRKFEMNTTQVRDKCCIFFALSLRLTIFFPFLILFIIYPICPPVASPSCMYNNKKKTPCQHLVPDRAAKTSCIRISTRRRPKAWRCAS